MDPLEKSSFNLLGRRSGMRFGDVSGCQKGQALETKIHLFVADFFTAHVILGVICTNTKIG